MSRDLQLDLITNAQRANEIGVNEMYAVRKIKHACVTASHRGVFRKGVSVGKRFYNDNNKTAQDLNAEKVLAGLKSAGLRNVRFKDCGSYYRFEVSWHPLYQEVSGLAYSVRARIARADPPSEVESHFSKKLSSILFSMQEESFPESERADFLDSIKHIKSEVERYVNSTRIS